MGIRDTGITQSLLDQDLIYVPVAELKHPYKSKLREKGFIWLTVSEGYSPSWLEWCGKNRRPAHVASVVWNVRESRK